MRGGVQTQPELRLSVMTKSNTFNNIQFLAKSHLVIIPRCKPNINGNNDDPDTDGKFSYFCFNWSRISEKPACVGWSSSFYSSFIYFKITSQAFKRKLLKYKKEKSRTFLRKTQIKTFFKNDFLILQKERENSLNLQIFKRK